MATWLHTRATRTDACAPRSHAVGYTWPQWLHFKCNQM